MNDVNSCVVRESSLMGREVTLTRIQWAEW